MGIYKGIIDWKVKEFDKKVQEKMQIELLKTKLMTDSIKMA